MKRITLAAGLVALTTMLSACGGSSTPKAADATTAAAAAGADTTMSKDMMMIDKCEVHGEAGSIKLTTVKADTLTLVTSLPAPGWFNGADPESVKDGYEYCMAAQIAHLAGLKKISLMSVNFDQLVAGATKDYDIGLAETSITDKRKLVIDFSDPYFASDIGLLADAKNADTYKDTASLKDAVIGVQQDTTGAQYIQEKLQGKVKEIKVLPDSATLFTALTAGQITLAATDTSIVQEQEKKGAGATKVVGQFKTGESYGVILPKGSVNTAEINKAVKMLTDDGSFGKLGSTYLSGDPGSVPVFTP
jgi:polar amino acid transport system substrate-binding protein